MLEIEQIPVLRDNYIYLIRDSASGLAAVVDPAVPEPVLERLAAKRWQLAFVLNTHHHNDHVGGNLALKAATGCRVVGAHDDSKRIPGIDIEVSEGDVFTLGDSKAEVIALPGHTSFHIAYWFASDHALFCGDTMFALGCGRLFEGTPAQMWNSLSKLRALPGDTMAYCAHEYTQANARFARAVDPGNQALLARSAEIDRRRADALPTVPSSISVERDTNPFLRADIDSVKQSVGMAGADPVSVFAEIRRRKDVF